MICPIDNDAKPYISATIEDQFAKLGLSTDRPGEQFHLKQEEKKRPKRKLADMEETKKGKSIRKQSVLGEGGDAMMIGQQLDEAASPNVVFKVNF